MLLMRLDYYLLKKKKKSFQEFGIIMLKYL
jgi:hypothetical protein